MPHSPNNTNLQSIFFILLSKLAFVGMMSVVKYLKGYSPLQLNFLRSVIIFCSLVPFLLFTRGVKGLKTQQPFAQIVRMVLSATSMICFFYGYRILTIAKASAINFSYALIVPALSCLLLKECVSWRRWVYLVLGYIGILIIIDPVFETIDQGEMIALIGVFALACASILVKKLTKTDDNFVVVFYSSVATTVILGGYFLSTGLWRLPPSFPHWKPIHPKDYYWIASIVGLSLLGQFTYVEAYRRGRLNFLAGFDYLKFLFAAVLGYIAFGEILESTTFYGALIILICSYLNTKEELKAKD